MRFARLRAFEVAPSAGGDANRFKAGN